jgi:hypothetical protein
MELKEVADNIWDREMIIKRYISQDRKAWGDRIDLASQSAAAHPAASCGACKAPPLAANRTHIASFGRRF